MEAEAIRAIIRQKFQDGRLPRDSMPRFFGVPGNGEECGACGMPIKKDQLVMEGLASKPSDKKPVQLHVVCFQLWDHERRAAKRRAAQL